MKLIHRIKTLLREWRDGVNPPVFFAAAAFNVALILFAGLWTETAGKIFQTTLTFITETFG
jgi:choline/glycine/proline betaine transport protein